MNRKAVGTDWYQLLGVERGATAGEIRSAYRREARQHHPDRNADPDAQARMAAINEARAVLLDPVRRAKFDHELPPVIETAPAPAGESGKRVVRGRPLRRTPASPPASRPAPDWCAFLGVSRRASQERIAAAVTQRAEEFERIPNPHKREESKSWLMDAWRTLRDPASRAVYDLTLDR